MSENFLYDLSENTVVFTDSIKINKPCIFTVPRNHESLFFVTKGNLLYEKCGENTIISEGNVGYIAKGSIDTSSAYKCEDVSYIAVNFNFSINNNLQTTNLPFKTLCSNRSSFYYEKIFTKLLNDYVSKKEGCILICNGILMQIIGNLYNELKNQNNYKEKEKIVNSLKYLNSNYDKVDFSINEMAFKSNMSEKNFRRIFKKIFNTTPYKYLQEFRINKAEILLTNTSKSINEIALQCGFSDVYSFSHCFKNHNKVSPNNYRNMFF